MFPEVQKEMLMAREAARVGNEGRARVCARRAVGAVIEQLQITGYGSNAMARLRGIREDDSLPVEVREAAARLEGDVRSRESAPFSVDPLGDAEIIVTYFSSL